jgi:hypothetical protein
MKVHKKIPDSKSRNWNSAHKQNRCGSDDQILILLLVIGERGFNKQHLDAAEDQFPPGDLDIYASVTIHLVQQRELTSEHYGH